MQNWINKQTEINVSQFDKVLEVHYPGAFAFFTDPAEYYRGITTLWNYLDAAKLVEWDKYLRKDSVVLDLAGGPGYLSAYLSRNNNISKIYNVDSSRYFLSTMMPELVRLMGGDNSKIEPVEGLFTPLLFGDGSIDLVAVSSSLHHADNLENVLKEIRRVLKPGGSLIILNETPLGYWKHLLTAHKLFLIFLKDTLLRKYKSVSPRVSSSGLLYAPYLNDTYYPFWYWKKAIRKTGFKLSQVIKTGLFTNKSDVKGVPLVNFVCEKP